MHTVNSICGHTPVCMVISYNKIYVVVIIIHGTHVHYPAYGIHIHTLMTHT